ncbi:MAG: NAD(P)H-hydrate epimerase [Candidatus Aenigmarchaeota archaeon]|nr:NAD(P)H-hydrate epimerase [Candidatus Aenigmarchaeota archaeon]
MISVKSMRAVERKASAMGIDDSILMENAGANAARIVDDMVGLRGREVLVFCGTGNNAGDGLVFARHALILGAKVRIYMMRGKGFLKPLAKRNYAILKNLGLAKHDVGFYTKITPAVSADILVDAMLGIGLKGKVSDEYGKAISLFNSMPGIKVSLDCPSGIDADTGRSMGNVVRPDITITFHDRKRGLSKRNCGQLALAGIGMPK